MNIALLGPSGAGKGTHVATLVARHRLRHLATGDLFRRSLQERTALGLLARRYMERGELVPDEVVDAMIEEWADTLPADSGALFDGFPRTVDQVRFLDELLRRLGRRLDVVVYLRLGDDEIVERLAGREICRRCQAPYHARFHPPREAGLCDVCGGGLHRRTDDTEELTRARLRVFHRSTEPVLEGYADAGRLLIVPGAGSIAEVDRRLEEALAAVGEGRARFATRTELRGTVPAAPLLLLPRPDPLRKDFVLLGAPGSGKGTQAEVLCRRLGVPHIATGDLFRAHLRQSTALGQAAKAYMDRGELVPDDVTDAMVEDRLVRPDAAEGFMLDGFPRTLHQAQALGEMMSRLHRSLAGVLFIRVSDAAIVERLSGRLICRECQAPYHMRFNPPGAAGRCDHCGGELYQRDDDKAETVRARLATFHRQTEPLVAYFRGLGLLREIDGEDEMARITEKALKLIGDRTGG